MASGVHPLKRVALAAAAVLVAACGDTAMAGLEVIAHRGASAHAPENTITAIQMAKALGADRVEVDVFGTSDHVPVLMHDPKVDRTTNGTGYVSGYTLEQIKTLDAGSWFHTAYSGEQVPTLAEALTLDVPLLLDVKISTPQVLDTLAAQIVGEDVIVTSFNLSILESLRRRDIQAPLWWTVTDATQEPPGWLDGVAARYEVAPEFVARYADAVMIAAWTVNDPALVPDGVDAIITDTPWRLGP